MSKMKRYARTVKSGERPLMVWTRETGILEVAFELKRWPNIWNAARGRVVRMTSRDGYRIGCRSAGTAARSRGNVEASHEKSMQYDETKANWTRVKVAGLSKAVRIALDEVLVRADDPYHIMQSACE
jgi:hypothetical protein